MQMAISVSRSQGTYSRKASAALWTVQTLLAVLFLFAGGFKLAVPWELMAEQMVVPLPELFVRVVAACEVLGAVGLILPGLTRIHRELTPVAAAGLLVIMVGATTISLAADPASAVLPLVTGALAASIVRGRIGWLAR
jgi:uncharacterized membrane protein YphA (DoxX/SURF4 family)